MLLAITPFKLYIIHRRNKRKSEKEELQKRRKKNKTKDKEKERQHTLPPPHHKPAKAFLCVIPRESLKPIYISLSCMFY